MTGTALSDVAIVAVFHFRKTSVGSGENILIQNSAKALGWDGFLKYWNDN
jgi:hypothetical protein